MTGIRETDRVEGTDDVEGPGERRTAEVRLSPIGRFFRFLGWWLGFTGLYATFSVCPFCGQPGCPVGIASAGTVGAFLALCMQDSKRLLGFLRGKMAGKKRRDAS
jgi:hypothetical protein